MEQGASVVSGPVAHANYARLMDWVVYFTEYNSYMPPFERGQTSNVCGANCAYRRDLLLDHMPSEGSGYWEADLNNRLLLSGHQFSMEPELVVHHTGPFGFQYYLWQRFLFSRAFAATRQTHLNLIQKATYLLGAPFLVPLLLARIGVRVLTKGHRVGRFVAGLPILVPVAVVYVAGEWVGLTMGAGDSLSKIE
jgi:hypothetical protein